MTHTFLHHGRIGGGEGEQRRGWRGRLWAAP